MLYATTSLFHFLGSMKFLGEYRECRFAGVQEKRDVVQRAIHFMQENLNKKNPSDGHCPRSETFPVLLLQCL